MITRFLRSRDFADRRPLRLSTSVFVLLGGLVTLPALEGAAEERVDPAATGPLTFEAVYEEARFYNSIENALDKVDQYLAEQKSPEAEALKANLKIDQIWLNFQERTGESDPSVEQLSSFLDSLKPLYAEVSAAVDRVPDNAVAQELKGEAGSVLSGYMLKLVVAKSQAGQDYDETLEEAKRISQESTEAFEKSLALDDTRARPHVALAFELSGSTGGMADPRIMEHALLALEKSPRDPAPVDLIIQILRETGSSLHPGVRGRVIAALRGTAGRCRDDLLESQQLLHNFVTQAMLASEAMAAAGVDQGVGEDVFRTQDALAIIDAALPRKR